MSGVCENGMGRMIWGIWMVDLRAFDFVLVHVCGWLIEYLDLQDMMRLHHQSISELHSPRDALLISHNSL